MMISELRTFVLLAEEGSIGKVAERLPLTQPAVTRQIQRLENALGLELLDRRQKPPLITPAGLEAIDHARRILAELEDLRRLGRDREPAGLLKLGIANGLAGTDLARIVAEARVLFPQVTLRLTSSWSDDLSHQVDRGVMDAAVLLSEAGSQIHSTLIGMERLAIIGSSAWNGRAAEASDFADVSWILSPEPCEARRRLGVALASSSIPFRVAAEVQDARLQLALVRENLGLGLLPRRLLAEPLEGIKEIPVDWPELTFAIRVSRSPFLRSLTKVVDHFALRLVDNERRNLDEGDMN